MADFPTSIFEPRTTENLPGVEYDPAETKEVFAEDYSLPSAEIVAIQETLGENPQGAYSTVKAWLEALSLGGSSVWGAITGTLADQTDLQSALNGKQASLGFTPENVANKDTDGTLAANSDTKYASQKATKTYADTKQSALGFTPENVANKDTDGTLAANSDTKYASQKATKTYVDSVTALLSYFSVDGDSFEITADEIHLIGHVYVFSGGIIGGDYIGVLDTDGTNGLRISWDENDSSDRLLKFKVNGADRNISLKGDVTLPLSDSPSTGIGFATGAGGAQTQSSSKTTGVTLNTICGAITMNNAALAGGAEAEFTVTNSSVAARDCVIVNVASGATATTYMVSVSAVAAGSFKIIVSNVSGTSRSEAIVLNFAIIKAVNA